MPDTISHKSHKTTAPRSIGVILDGNRRWARAKGFPTLDGHRAGYNKIKEFIGWARDAGVRVLVAYVFSTENWHRASTEVSYLMNLLREALAEREISAYKKENVQIRVIGDRAMLNSDMQTMIARAEEHTKDQTGLILAFALSYGGRREIVDAASRLAESVRNNSFRGTVDEKTFAQYLWTAGIPDPDLIIRTGGEQRLSNFLLWQAAYSELFFTVTLWPDFSKEEFGAILSEYAKRERRFGG